MLTAQGVKLLDFGLAKLRPSTVAVSGLSAAATAAAGPITVDGVIVGTLTYMAPEQLEGREADARADIWALGAVLYEMLTGRAAFGGRSQATVIATILSEEPPPLSAAQPLTPPVLDGLVRACLDKDPAERWQSAHDVRQALRWVERSAGVPAAVPAPRSGRWERISWALVAALALMSGALFGNLGVERSVPTITFDVIPPGEPNNLRIQDKFFALSPNGEWLAFAATTNDVRRLWVRRLDSSELKVLPGTEDVAWPFWSADSESLAFFASGKLKRVDLSGTPPRTLCDAVAGAGGTWNRDGVIVFGIATGGGLIRVDAAGGDCRRLTQLAAGQVRHTWPQFLPEGRLSIFGVDGRPGQRGIYVGSVDGDEPRRLQLASDSPAVFAPPVSLLFAREGALASVPFDPRQATITGDSRVVTAMEGFSFSGPPGISASATGIIA